MNLECLKCKDNFCGIYLGQRNCAEHYRPQNCFCVNYQVLNIEEKSCAVLCSHCNFFSECYAWKYLGRINGRKLSILPRHGVHWFVTKNCLHKDEVSVKLNRIIQQPNYSYLIHDVSLQKQIYIKEQGACFS